MAQNPFVQRNLPLSELLQRQQRYSQPADAPGQWYQRAQLRNTNEALDRFKPMQPRPMQPQPRPMQPMPMQPQPRPMQPMPMQAPAAPGFMGAAPGGTSANVTVSGGQSPMPAMGPWGGLGLGGGMGMGGGGTPYGGYQNFGGFSAAQPYRSVNFGGFTGGGFGFPSPYTNKSAAMATNPRGVGGIGGQGGSYFTDPRERIAGGFR